MASSKPYILTFYIFFFIFINSLSTSISTPSVYDILPEYSLPSGLLPDCVTNYTFSPDNGNFAVELAKPCYVQFDYLVYYDKLITGTLKIGAIIDLKGIQVKRLLFWFNVDQIKVDLPPSDSIYFQVGLINKKLDVDQFKSIHSCTSGVSVPTSPRSWNTIFQLPPPLGDEIPMLLTE